ncbi:hypothetical protein IAI19_11715, partial [Streptococcus pseudopneumoniae]|uniref:hypothetical protein n=1 Tax=Streptococcus pseudopneumoniae TaxID=257758 RepID=UPI0018B0EC09
DNLKRFSLLLTGVGILLGSQILPFVNELIDAFIRWNAETGASIGFVGTLVDVFKTLAGAAVLVAGSFEAISAFIGAGYGNL